MRNNRRIISVLLLICLLVVLVPANWVKAEEKEEDKNAKQKITISVNGIIYENVKGGTECIIGDTDINDIEVKIISVDGHELENVGTKSGVLDALGRTVLEFNTIEIGDGIWNIRMCYHDVDDPVESNHGYGFDITGIVFKRTASSKEAQIKVADMKNVKLTASSKTLKVSWKKVKCDGYQIQYSTVKSKLSSAKKIKVSAKKTSYTIKGLKSSKKYYVRIRAYEKYTDYLGNAKIRYGKWTTLGKKTAK